MSWTQNSVTVFGGGVDRAQLVHEARASNRIEKDRVIIVYPDHIRTYLRGNGRTTIVQAKSPAAK